EQVQVPGIDDVGGKKKKTFEELVALSKLDIFGQIGDFRNMTLPCFTDDQLYLKTSPIINQEIDNMEEESMIRKAFSDESGDILQGDRIVWPTESKNMVPVRDKRAAADLVKSLGKFMEEADSVLFSQFYDENDEAASELTLGFIKAATLGPMNRMINGHTRTFIALHTPLVDAVSAIIASVDSRFDASLPKRLKANEEFYPLVSIINKSERCIQTLSDYWKEKEDAAGKMPPARKQQFRQSIYDQAKRLLPLIDTMSEASKDEAKRAKITDSRLHVSGNEDPFVNALEASRGALQLKSTLQAYEAALKNGWDIDDVGPLATFNFMRLSAKNACKYTNECLTLKAFNANKDKEPVYREGEKDFIDKMDEVYERLSGKCFENAKERTDCFEEMKKIVADGVKDGFIDSAKAEYFDQAMKCVDARSKMIEKGKEPVSHPNSVSDEMAANYNELDMQMYKFGKKRSIIFFGRESDEHKKLRIAVEELESLELRRKNPENLQKPSDEEYLQKLDEVLYRSKLYQKEKEKKGTPGTSAGKKRLEGAKKYEEFAKQSRKEIADKLNAGKPDQEKLSVKQLRIKIAKQKADTAKTEIGKMERIPDGDGKRRFMEYAADILVGGFAASQSESLQNGFLIKGANVLKKELLASKEFNRMISSFIRENKAINEVVDELSGDVGINKLRSLNEKVRREAEDKKTAAAAVKNSIKTKNDIAKAKV
ncbi:MAG: hypothetical protein J5842_00505, partial [Lachnospiraceae bacterium]|nr:hypothetical protein [Lachnospiraceae bacterium]